MVTDPLLKEHLAHWGINMMQMDKTAKTMAEMEVRRCPPLSWPAPQLLRVSPRLQCSGYWARAMHVQLCLAVT